MSLTTSSERLTGRTGGIAEVYSLAGAPIATAPVPAPAPQAVATAVTSAPPERNALAGLPSTPAGRLARLLPDGYGVTIRFRGQPEAAFRDYGEATRAIAAAPPGSITSVILYGHGAPGMLSIGGSILDAGEVGRLLAGKLAPNARVTLYGCNTAGVGDQGLSRNLAESAFFGLSSLMRRLTYFSLPVLTGADRAAMEDMWDDDMALDVSRALPDAEVVGFRTYAFPADRLVPGAQNATPSRHVLARSATYKNGDLVTGARRPR
ncbi:MAG: hypothetical protein ACAI38_24635 [Myxococcota bacterium]